MLIIRKWLLVLVGGPPLREAGRSSLQPGGRFGVLEALRVQAHLPTVWHLFLVGVIVVTILFWLALAFWIVVRLLRTAHIEAGEPLP